MSQVVCTKDKLAAKRKQSYQAEKNIDINAAYVHWHKKPHPMVLKLERLLRIALGAHFLLWLMIILLISLPLLLVIGACKFLGKLLA